MLKDEFHYFLAHLDEMVEKYNGKVIVMKNHTVIGVYDSELKAIEETKKTDELGTFLVQRVKPGKDSYTMTFHSRFAPIRT
jgi:hypothetical protein